MKANSDNSKQSNKATRRVLAGVLCGASVLSLVLSLVMPPISQAIANDAEAGAAEETVAAADSSTESTDVENTNNGDTEKQNSVETEGDEAGDDSQPEEQPEEEQQNEGTTTSDGETVVTAAENEQAETASDEMIDSAGKLKEKLKNASGIANFELTKDIVTNETIQLNQKGSNITLNLNGHKIKHESADQPLFNITGGATLTIKDLINGSDPEKASESVSEVKQLNDQGQNLDPGQNFDPDNYGKEAKLVYDTDDIPSGLTYYVTQSSPSAIDTTKTTETLYKHSVDIKGAIVACGGSDKLRLINLYAGGTFKLESGVITQQQNTQQKQCRVDSLVYAENGSNVNMSGGYVCGASTGTSGTGAGIIVNKNGDASSLNLTGGVIAANYALKGAGVYSNGSNVSISKDAVISGNATFKGESDQPGYGGGIMAEGGTVTVSGGCITNNRMAKFCRNEGWGCHGGAGLAANNGARVAIFGGQITGNYSEEAGGGVYVTNQKQQGMAWLKITGGIIASNVSHRSEGAGIRVGQQVDAMINGTPDSKVYITHNRCMSRFDWGGGGIFVQGNSIEGQEKTAGRLFVYNSYISSNTAGGYGGGVAVCPTGKTLVTNTEGTAIFGNSSAGNDRNFKEYNRADGTGNDGTPHLSAGGAEGTNKTEDQEAYNSEDFRKYGHADFFLAATGHTTPVAVVSGKMLGDIDAKYSGSIELKGPITIPANGVAQVKNSIGLASDVNATDKAVTDLVQGKVPDTKVTTFITDNYSWDHGGGIMSNGDLYLGQPADTYVYPSLKLKATKELTGRNLKAGDFTFTVYRKDSDAAKAPSWDDNGNFSTGGCDFVESAQNNADGNIAFDLSEKLSELLSEQFKASGTGETTYYDITYYLVENAGDKLGVKYDHAVYEIKVKVKCTPTVLMSVPIQGKTDEFKDLNVYNYTIDRVDVTKHDEGLARNLGTVSPGTDGYYSIVDSSSATSTNKATFTNTYDPEVSWTPMATKVVEGGEMKEFTLQLATDSHFKDEDIIGTAVTSDNDKKQTKQTLSFKDKRDETIELKYKLSDIRNNPDDPGGPFKTFKYYVREETDGSQFSHYTYDQSVYQFTVVPTYNTEKGEINCRVTYKKGTVDSDGTWKATDTDDNKFPDTTPTFTNTYSTSLPLSGMSGVTLTYLAGAAVLCAAAAWMHIRRKANAKGGKRRE